MAKKDKKKWEELFYSRFGYQPTSVLRKKRAVKFSLYDLFEITDEIGQIFSIHLIFPFEPLFPMAKKPVDSVVIFPQTIYCDTYIKGLLYEVNESILYKGNLYSLDRFILECPPLDSSYDPSSLNPFSLSSSMFMFSTDEFSQFKKLYLTPIRKKIIETTYILEKQGMGKKKSSSLIEERNKLITQKAREWKRPNLSSQGLSIKIRDYLYDEAIKRFPEKENDIEQRKDFKVFSCGEDTVVNVIRPITKEFKKK